MPGPDEMRSSHAEYMRQRRNSERALEIPPVADRERRLECEAHPDLWLQTYIPHKFWRDFTSTQERMISELSRVARYGGDKALAATRGEGKTATAESLCGHYGVVTGQIRYGVILAATGTDAGEILQNVKDEYEDNEILAADYPEVCIPVLELKGAPQAAGTQHIGGDLTRMKWSGTALRFPKVMLEWCPKCYWPDPKVGKSGLSCPKCKHKYDRWASRASSAAFTARGVDGSLRGLRKREQRPDIVILDDIETEEVAQSVYQQQKLDRKIEKAIGGLSGPGMRMGRLWLCTIQEVECLAATYTDPSKKPSFKGERFRQVKRWPDRKDLWEQYIEKRQDGMRLGDDPFGHGAADFYEANRDKMETGAVVTNEHRFDSDPDDTGRPKELSAIQHVHNQAADKGWDFVFCEYQNDPPEPADMSGMPTKADLLRRVNNHAQWEVPADVQSVTAFIDCGQDVLWWSVVGWTQRFGGHVLAYGVFPDQRRQYFRKAEAGPTMGDWYTKKTGKVGTVEEVLYAALEELSGQLLSRNLVGQANVEYSISRLGVDAGWKAEVVYRFAQQNVRGGLIVPMKGFGVRAKDTPLLQRNLKQGERRGTDWAWRYVHPEGKKTRLLEVDVNFGKHFVHERLSVPLGGDSPIAIYGKEGKDSHVMYVDHLLSERRELVEVPARGQSKHEYSQRPDVDNDWLDTLVGCAALASFDGVLVDGQSVQRPKKLKLSDIQKRRQGAR